MSTKTFTVKASDEAKKKKMCSSKNTNKILYRADMVNCNDKEKICVESAVNAYGIKELEQNDIQKALGFTDLGNGLYAGTIGNLLVIYEDNYGYTVYDGGVNYIDEILDIYTDPNTEITQEDIKNDLGVDIKEYQFFEEI